MSLVRNLRTLCVLLTICFSGMVAGCGSEGNSVVPETDEYSYDDVAAQIAAEEEAASSEDSE